eukprot:scaffold93266_cov54-Attheya_sp.AAC.1
MAPRAMILGLKYFKATMESSGHFPQYLDRIAAAPGHFLKIPPAPVLGVFLPFSTLAQGHIGIRFIGIRFSDNNRGPGGEAPARTTCYARLPEEVMIFEHYLWPQA